LILEGENIDMINIIYYAYPIMKKLRLAVKEPSYNMIALFFLLSYIN